MMTTFLIVVDIQGESNSQTCVFINRKHFILGSIFEIVENKVVGHLKIQKFKNCNFVQDR